MATSKEKRAGGTRAATREAEADKSAKTKAASRENHTPQGANDQKKVLRIAVIIGRQGARIDDERLIPYGKPVTVGRAPQNVFAFPSSKLPDTFTLFQPSGPSRYTLRISEKMDGRITFKPSEEAVPFSEIKASNRAVKKGELYEIALEGSSSGKIVLRDITLLFQFVPAPPPPVKPVLPKEAQGGLLSQIDRVLALIFLVSFSIHATIGTVALTHVVPKLDPEFTEDDSLIRLLIKPQPLVVEPPPEEELVVEEEETDKTEVAEAKNNTPTDQPKGGGSGGSPNPGPVGSPTGKGGGTDVRNVGLAGAIGREGVGGAFADLYAGATDADIEDAFNTAAGPTKTASAGDDIGAGLQRGEPGGGNGEGTLADLGSDIGAQGANTNVPTAPTKTEKKVTGTFQTTGTKITTGEGGTLDSASIQKVVGKARGPIEACYTRALTGNNTLEGKLTVQFVINEAGRVINTSAIADSVNSSDVTACVLRIISRLRFPENPGGGNVTASSTFVFTPTK